MRPRLAFALFLLLAPTIGLSQAPAVPRSQLTAHFREQLADIAKRTNGVVGIGIVDLKSGETFGVNEGYVFPQGSAIKIPILIELFRQAEAGTVSLADRLPVRATDQVAGTGVAQFFADGTSQLALRDLATLMIVLSDNTATNILIERLGMERVSATMQALGLGEVRLRRRMIKPRESAAGNENVATPAQAAALMRRIHTCELPVSRAACAELRRILEIPKDGPIPASVPEGIPVAWKPGSVEGVETAWGLVNLPGNPYVVVAMVSYSDEGEAQRALRQVADAAWEYFRRVTRASAYGVRVPLSLADSVRIPR